MSMCEAHRMQPTLKIDYSVQNTARSHNKHCAKTNEEETNIAFKTAWNQHVCACVFLLVLL